MRCSGSAAFSCGFLFCVWLTSVQAAESKPAWEKSWEQTVEAGKKEGQVTIYHTRGPFDNVFADFNKRYPGIKLVSIVGRGGDLISRIMGERRAEKYLTDIYLGSSGTPMDVLYPAKFLEPVESILILPGVREPSNWFRKQHDFADPEGKYVLVFGGVVRSDMEYDNTVVGRNELST